MTSVEMHIGFRVKFNQVNANKNKAFLSQEIDLFLNDQMDKFVELRTDREGNYKNEGFEESQRRLDEIRTVIKENSTNAALTPPGTLVLSSFDKGKKITLPVDYKKLVFDGCDTDAPCNFKYSYVQNRLTSNQLIGHVLHDKYHTSHPDSPVSQIVNSELRVYENNFTVTHIYITYVYDYPRIVYNVQDCVLPKDTHREIVDMAVSKVNAILRTGNYEAYVNEISKNE